MPYLSTSEVVIHDEALYQMYVHLPLSGEFIWCLGLGRACSVLVCSQSQVFLCRVNSDDQISWSWSWFESRPRPRPLKSGPIDFSGFVNVTQVKIMLSVFIDITFVKLGHSNRLSV